MKLYRIIKLGITSFLIVLTISCSGDSLDFREATAEDILSAVAEYSGEKAVLVNFWATWCVPCIEEFPMIVDLSEKYADDVKILFVSGDWLDYKERARNYLKERGVKGLSFIQNQKDNEFINGIHKDWSGALPFTIVYGKKSGNVVDLWERKRSEERFVNAIEKAIKDGEVS